MGQVSAGQEAPTHERKHKVEQHHGYCVCVVCGGYSKVCMRLLARERCGPLEPRGKSERDDARRRRRDRIRGGLRPKTGKALGR